MKVLIIGGGIVGPAVARAVQQHRPGDQVTVVEKERSWGAHQTGHNSGVIHAGVYYRPGSLKARLCGAGRASMVEFCEQHEIRVETCGKLIVATTAQDLSRLQALRDRAAANGVPVTVLGPAGAREHEPNVACAGALFVPSTGIVDFGAVCGVLAEQVAEAGGNLRTGTEAVSIGSGVAHTTAGEIEYDLLINCAGLHADRVARMAGLRPSAKIIPFRGECYTLRPERRDRVRGLIYPLPDPALPFLGVHLTRMIDGSVHAGPNAVLALSREGYRWSDVCLADLAETLRYPGLWRLGRQHAMSGLHEVVRSVSKRRFADSLAELVPEITADDLAQAEAGVRAQAGLGRRPHRRLPHPDRPRASPRPERALSPAATSSLEIAKYIVDRLPA